MMKEKNISVKDFNHFLYSILCKRKRRRRLVLQWNVHQPFKGETLEQVMRQFIECILYRPIRFTIEGDHMSFFGEKLRIPFSWLQQDERAMLTRIYSQRAYLFKKEQKMQSDLIKLSQCIYDRKCLFSIDNRREMARDMIQYLCCLSKANREFYRYIFLRVSQQIIASSLFKTDRFVLELQHSLQIQSIVKLENIPVKDE